jgi:hypothetical protein
VQGYTVRGRKIGRPLTAAGKVGREIGMCVRSVRNNGLERELSPLARKCRLNQIKKAARRFSCCEFDCNEN